MPINIMIIYHVQIWEYYRPKYSVTTNILPGSTRQQQTSESIPMSLVVNEASQHQRSSAINVFCVDVLAKFVDQNSRLHNNIP